MRDRISDLREDKDLKQWEVAKAIGITPRKYSYIERGIQQPSKEELMKLADFYETSVDYLLGLTYVREPYPRGFREKSK